jgi:hypothetical protein
LGSRGTGIAAELHRHIVAVAQQAISGGRVTNLSGLIDEMIEQTPDWRGAALAEFRRIIHDADPDIVEEVKWRRPSNPGGAPVFEHAGIVCTANILKERVRLSFPSGFALPDPHEILTAVTEGNKTRIIDLREGDTVDEDALKDLVRAAVDRNLAKAGTRRKK